MRFKNIHILVVDDSAVLKSIGHFLEDYGAIVTTASNSIVAWSLIASRSFDYIISDVCMPYLSGVELLDKIGGTFNKDAKVILISGASQYQELDESMFKAIAFLRKPIQFNALTKLLSETI